MGLGGGESPDRASARIWLHYQKAIWSSLSTSHILYSSFCITQAISGAGLSCLRQQFGEGGVSISLCIFASPPSLPTPWIGKGTERKKKCRGEKRAEPENWRVDQRLAHHLVKRPASFTLPKTSRALELVLLLGHHM